MSPTILERWRRIGTELFSAPLEPILHASTRRLKFLGAFTLIGHPLFYWFWSTQWPQPYDNLALRMATAMMGAPLLLDAVADSPNGKQTRRVFGAAAFVQLPLLFSWMYQMNGYNAVWLASLAGAVLIYFHLTDWRIAAAGTIVGFGLGMTMADRAPPTDHMVCLAFMWLAGLLLGMSSANLRRERLANTLATMGIMAHELRTPLAATHLIGESLRQVASRQCDRTTAANLDRLADRLLVLARTMNHHIDIEIANARLLQKGPSLSQRIDVAELVRTTVADYPFPDQRERDSVIVSVKQNFLVLGEDTAMRQVLNNLIENALRALRAAKPALSAGDLSIAIWCDEAGGVIRVADNGKGMDGPTRARAFEPFFSTDQRTGHGLGLAYCRAVVQSLGGAISIEANAPPGATITIRLPAAMEKE